MTQKFNKVITIILLLLISMVVSNYAFGSKNSSDYSADSIEFFELIDSVRLNINNYDVAIDISRKAIKIGEESGNRNFIAESDYTLGYVFYNNYMPDSALFYFNRAIINFRETNNTAKELNVLNYIIYTYRELSDYNQAINKAFLGLRIADSLNLTGRKADFYLIMGSSYGDMGLSRKSVDALVKALTIFEEVNDSIGISAALINLGIILANDNNFNDALENIERALIICENIDDVDGISVCLNNIGDIYLSTKNYNDALVYFSRSLEMDKKKGDKEGIAICLFNIGESYCGLNDTILAESYYINSLKMGKSKDFSIAGITFVRLGELYLRKGDLNLALVYAIKSESVAKAKKNVFNLIDSYSLLTRCYAALGNHEEAYNYLLICKQLSDSAFSVDKSKHIKQISSKYKDEKQKEEINALKEKSTIATIYRTHLIRTIIAISFLLVVLFIVAFFIRRSKIKDKRQKLYFGKLLDRSEDFIFVIGKDGLTKYISPSYQRKIGKEYDNHIGKDSFEFIHPDDVAAAKEEFSKLFVDSIPRTFEFRMSKADGGWIYVSAYGQNLFDDPIIKGIVVNFWDITTRKKNEQIIKLNEIKFKQIFNSFLDIYFEADLNGVVTEISPSVKKITGYTREEIIGLNTKEYNSFIGDWRRIGAQFKIDSYINDFDTKVVIKNGSHIYCSFSVEYMVSDENVRVGIKGVFRDISSRVASQKKLRESQKNLKEANKSKELLFSIISHDLIGPIGTNKSIVDLIVDHIDEFSHEEIVALIVSLKPSLDSTFSLIENLLSWARIQQDRLKPNFEDISVNKMVGEMVSLLNAQANRKTISLKVVGTKPITVFADKSQLDISLRNLVSNAIKFSNQDGEVIISIDADDDSVIIKITDSGIGMSQEQIEDILVKGGSTKVRRGTDNEKGTGFGLIIVNEFIKNNNGRLNVFSKVGEGTTFVVTLPLSKMDN